MALDPPEAEALKKSFDYLQTSIDTAAILPQALSKQLISDRQRLECLSESDLYKKADAFLTYLLRSVASEREKFHLFLEILDDNNQRTIASRLRDELANVTSHRVQQGQGITGNAEDEVAAEQVVVPDDLVKELAKLRVAFAMLVDNYEDEIKHNHEAQAKFASFLPRLLPRRSHYQDFQSSFNMLINEEVSLFNVCYLGNICCIFPENVRARTKELVEDYEQKLEHFMGSTTVNQFKKLFPALATTFKLSDGKTRIMFKLQNWWGDHTILDLKKLVNRFGVSGECLHLSKVDEGCVAVTWLCSSSHTEELKSDINSTAKLLGTVGVTQVSIGEEIVFEWLNQKPLNVGIDLPKITPLISKLLEKYPDGGQILKELIQNADDAQAVEVKFMLDKGDHPCRGDDLLTPELVDFQGPALYAWNDAMFTDDDWEHIGHMYSSLKEKEPLKVGRFGVGFMSVFHMTDLPVIISGNLVGILDPHNKYTAGYFGSRQNFKAGLGERLSTFMSFPGHLACFNGIFGINSSTKYFDGSLFRFPLRKKNSCSEISEMPYSTDRVLYAIYESFFKEAPVILLFLKHVQQISLYDGSKLLYKVAIDSSQRNMVTSERVACKQCASNSTKYVLRAYSTTVQVYKKDKVEEYYWLIMNLIGRQNNLSQELGFLPWVGIAAPLPGIINLAGLVLEIDEIENIMQTLGTHHIKRWLFSMSTSMAWTGKAVGHLEGHIFCFLPLPGIISLPVNVHGYFAVADNRRNILWPSYDDKSDRAIWNEYLVQSLISPAYSVLLTIRSYLVSYNGTPLPLPFTEGDVTDPYAAWPLYSEVKNNEIWRELLKPTLNRVSSERILWTAAEKGKWVTPIEAVFLPDAKSSSAIPEVAIKVLIKAGVPVVSLPGSVQETLQHVHSRLLSQNVVTPARVRESLHNGQVQDLIEEITTDIDETQNLLAYVLSDVNQRNSHELSGLKLLPLATYKCTKFSNFSSTNIVYVLKSAQTESMLIKCLPGMEDRFVNPCLSLDLTKLLLSLANSKCSQLRLWEQSDCDFRSLFSLSLSMWSNYSRPGESVIWNPGRGHHPPINWLENLWQYLCKSFSKLSKFEGLPIVPMEAIQVAQIEHVTLVSLPEPTSRLNSNGYFFRSSSTVVGVLSKLSAKVVNTNQFVLNHRDIHSYISDINILTILSFLANCQDKIAEVLSENDKSELRKEIARSFYELVDREQYSWACNVVKALPIFVVGVGSTRARMVALDMPCEIDGQLPVLPSQYTKFDSSLCYPPNILSQKEQSAVSLIRSLGQDEVPFDELCCDHLIPFALSQCKQCRKWCNGDDVFVWILNNLTPPYSSVIMKCLRSTPFVRTNTEPNVLVKPCELYSSEKQFEILFNVEKDCKFAYMKYKEEGVFDKLELCGLQTWMRVKADHVELTKLLKERAKSVVSENTVSSESALQRSCFITKLATKCNLMDSLCETRFLFSQATPPVSFPSGLKWFGKTDKKLHAPEDICVSDCAYLVGSVIPVLRSDYSNLTDSIKTFFHQPTVTEVISQLNELVSIPVKGFHKEITAMVEKIYDFLSCHADEFGLKMALPHNWIWCRSESTGAFRSTTQFVIQSPLNLSPFLYSIDLDHFLSQYKDMFRKLGVQDRVEDSRMVAILAKLGQTHSQLTKDQLELAKGILKCLHDRNYISQGDVLMLTAEETLKPAKECVYDDRTWVKQKAANISHYFTFVHVGIPLDQAMQFGAVPLSHKVAPSKRLDFRTAGPHESITKRIRGIVNDYGGKIDVFKELIQNADDAKATQVKFVIDWREHGKKQLLTEELGSWQGPALLAYNNAVFSDEDLDKICKVAGETKMKDPMKTGRFGLGFCSTYYLTDVPSFVSQRYFTMFDPHTWYLKDRVSHNQPGISIDLVDSQEDLQVYKDQFVPFDGLFGCKVFQLEQKGFPGTIFRFPFRRSHNSNICYKCNFENDIKYLLQNFQREFSSILIFLKNVKQVEVFVLDKAARQPLDMKQLCSVTKRSENIGSRMDMILHHSSCPQPTSSSCVIEFDQSAPKQSHSSHQYIVASALSSEICKIESEPGMIPLAEIAMEVVEEDHLLIPKPLENALMFYFLPLPIESHLPFHINGFFDVGKDRRNLTDAQDSFGSEWNCALAERGVPLALECLVTHFAEKWTLQDIDIEKKHDVLDKYYRLWLGSRKDSKSRKLTNIIVDSSKHHLAKIDKSILWCDIDGGRWVKPCEAYLVFDAKLHRDTKVEGQVVTLLLQNNYPVLPVSTPHDIKNILKGQLGSLNHLFTYKKFFSEVFIPSIQSIDAAVRIDQLVFALKAYYADSLDNSSEFAWLKNILKSAECIPTQSTRELVKPEQLIDPRTLHLASLYSPGEGRFPDETFVKDRTVMLTLGEFGMVTRRLPTSELVKRAQKFADEQTFNENSGQMKALFNYLLCFESMSQAQPREEQVDAHALWKVKFLKAISCPLTVTLPWCSVQQLFSPSQVFSAEHLYLVFTQKPLVDFPDEQNYRLLKCLRISTNKPDVNIVLEHTTKLITYLCEQGIGSIDADTCTYLNDTFQSIYKYLVAHCWKKEDSDKIKACLTDKRWIWQDGHLFFSSQVVRSWDYNSTSYLCELSVANKSYIQLFELLGVQNEATVECLLQVLQQVKYDFDENPLSSEVLVFVANVIRKLSIKHSISEEQFKDVDVFLPDENAVLRPASQMTCDSNLKGEWVEKLPVFEEFLENGGYFLHKDIPREHGLTLGAKPIIDALLKEIEDDTFIDDTDFGQEENLVDRLNSILKKYSDDVAIFREFVQNAEDAQASELVFVLDHRDNFPDQALFRDNHQWRKFQKAPALCIFNNRPFSENDLRGICQLGSRGKSFSDETIGRFGIGFNVAYHFTDCPMYVTYDGAGTPANFCVFDPLCHYINVSVRQKPGRRWKVTNQYIHQFSDQFQPFLNDKFSELKSLAPHCLQDLSHGYVVFRLPLVRKRTFDGERASSLCEGTYKSLSTIEELFRMFKDFTAKESLLFLSHLKHISCFQISRDGECSHNFTSTIESASSCLSSSGTYQLKTRFTETRTMYRGKQSINSEFKWLIHKQKGFKASHSALLEKAGKEGLKPTGGVAALLGCPSQTGRLFCFLPMLSPSGVPVHLNAHFLVDDSQKHLTTVKGLEQWNPTLGSEILVPSYVELILSARECVTGSQKSIKWFYGLFPDLTLSSALDDELRIGTGLYKSLLTLNCPVLVDLRSLDKRNGLKWLCPLASSSVGQAHFCKSYYSESRQIQVDDSLKDIFLSLGIPITCAPDYVFDSFCHISLHYGQESGLVTPRRVLDHLKQIDPMTEACETVIKQNCRRLLKFCIQGVNSGSIKSLLTGAPLLLSMAETLETSGSLFRSHFSSLLPHCQQLFINPNLTGTDTGLSNRLHEAGVICPLEVKIVADNIQLQEVVDCTCVRLTLSECKTIELFWKYINSRLVSHARTSQICTEINTHFLHHPILPALDGFYYPPRLGKCVFKREQDSDDMVLSAMKKLGYAELNDTIIGDAVVGISSLVASPHRYKDVVECLTLKIPICDVSFTSAEVYAFTHVLSQAGTISDNMVLCHLQSLPLFQAIDGSFTSLTGKAVHILSSDVPTAGLSALCKDACLVVLKDPGIFMGEFYRSVITDYERAICDASQFYCCCILPRVHCLSDTDLVEHLQYIRIHAQGSNSDWQKVVSILAQTPLIYVQKRNSRILVSELYDPENEFYRKFFKDKLLPVQWQTDEWLPFLRQLGLKTRVTEQEWLMKAIVSAKEAKQDTNIELCKGKCATLLATLEEIIEENTTFGITNDFEIFLSNASNINFIYCPAPPLLEQLIETVTGNKFKKSRYRMFTCFHESVSFKNRDLAGLSREILPKSCQFVMEDRRISKALCVREPLAAKVVVKNLLELSECLCSVGTAVMSSNITVTDAITKLRAIFGRHYEFLEKHEAGEKSVDELLETRCVLLSQSFVLVQPNQLVQHIPSQYDFQPFAYHVPPELRCFGKLLARLKVQEELTPLQYLQILANIKKEIDKSNSKLSEDQQYLRVCVDSFNALIISLRQHRPPLPDYSRMECYLPSQEYVLMEARQLVFNDSPWIGSRLQKVSTHQYKFILDPPPNENRRLTPPSCLGVKSLSSIAVEIVHPDVDLPTNRCVDDELQRCQWAQALQTTFGSKEFFGKGLGRLFWHEHKKHPKSSKDFRSLAVLLHKCEIKCVHDIKTVIHVENKAVPGTEDTSKLCHFVTQADSSGDQTLLYITHHESLLEQLASNITKFMKYLLKSESHIKAILDCKPYDIPKTLDQREVAPFDSTITAKNEGSQVGERFEGSLGTKYFLLICNYSSDEMVIYQPMNTEERKYARVVNTNFRPGCDVTETFLELQTDSSGNVNVPASVLEVYKILNTSQLAALWNTDLSSTDHSFAVPIILADVSCETSVRKTWLRSILHTSYPRKISTLCTLSQRLVVHLHYMLVTLKHCPEMFHNSVQELLEVLKSLPWKEGGDFKTCADQVEDVKNKVISGPVQVQEPIHVVAPPPVDSPFLLAPSAPSASSSIPSPLVRDQPTRQRSVYTATSAAISTAGALPHYPHYPTTARSRFSQLVEAHSRDQNTRFPTMLATASTPTQPRPRPVDPEKARMWLQQAKADLLAAHYLYSGISHLPDQNETDNVIDQDISQPEEKEGEGEEEEEEEGEEEKEIEWKEEEKEVEEVNEQANNKQSTCRFPALVCFLTHDVVEKCLKGVLYAKCGLPSLLQDSNLVVEIKEEVAKSSDVTQEFKQVARECTMLVNQHVAKSRYPNHQVPPCAPAAVYTALQASEALAAATKLMKNAAQLEGIGDLVGNLDNLPQTRLTTALSSMTPGQEVPSFWDEHSPGEEFKLVLLDPLQDEFHRISALFLQSMPGCQIKQIDRIQNKLLWRKYCNRARQMFTYDQVLGEMALFHGTASHKPEEIYTGDVSFDMRYCQSGMWGRGNYFAVDASYCNSYAHTEGGVRQMLMGNVLTGHSYQCHPDHRLTQPPFRLQSQGVGTVTRRYDSVCGVTGGSKVYIIYDNDKAYPAYLISYKCQP